MNNRYVILMLTVLMIGLLPLAAVAADATTKTTYDDHVRPIFRQHCLKCHDTDKKKGGLALDSYASALLGGSGGEVIEPGDLDSSRLWGLVSHDESPEMPPDQDRLGDEQLALVRRWIEGGALENSGSKASPKPRLAIATPKGSAARKPDGPAAMPVGVPTQPVVSTSRAGALTSLAASPWAPLVAVAGQRQVSLYETTANRLVGILPFPEGIPHVLQFSRNGDLLLVAGGHAAQLGVAALFDVRSGRRLTTVGEEFDVVLAADVIDDHSQIALGGPGGKVKVYATRDGVLRHTIEKHTEWIRAIEYSPDGVLLATADRAGAVWIWEAESAREYLGLAGHKASVTSISWRHDSNLLATASEDGSVRLWEMNDGRQIKTWKAHSDGVLSVSFTHDGRLVTAGRDKKIKLWNQQGKALIEMPPMTDIALAAVVTHDGKRVVAGDWRGEVRIWSASDRKEVGRLRPNPPTLEMRVAATTAHAKRTSAALATASAPLAAAQQSERKSAAALTEARRQWSAAVEVARQADASLVAMGRQVATSTSTAQKAANAVVTAIAAKVQADQQLKDTDKSVKTLQSEITRLQTVAKAARQTADQRIQSLAIAAAALAQANRKMAAAQVVIDRCKAASVGHEQRIAALRKTVDDAQRADTLAKSVADAAAQSLAKFRARPARLREEAARAQKGFSDAQVKASAQEADHQKAVEEAARHADAWQKLMLRAEALKKELAAHQSQQELAKRHQTETQRAVQAARTAAAKADVAARRAAADREAWEAAYGKGGPLSP